MSIPAILLLTVAAFSVPTQAGGQTNAIDAKLKDLAPEILDYCLDQGWKNVGVLNFQVKALNENGKDPNIVAVGMSTHVGQMNALMARRLENALIVANPLPLSKSVVIIGITRKAGEAALAQFKDQGDLDFQKPQSAKLLLSGSYPLAWGKEKVKVDAFLTGVVETSSKKTTVKVQVFDRENLKVRDVPVEGSTFTVKTDLSTLADVGTSFLIPRDMALRPDEELDLSKLQKVKLEKFLKFDVFYADPFPEGKDPNWTPALMKSELTLFGKNRVQSPKPGQLVKFELQSQLKETLGAVVLVNGINTYQKESPRALQQFSQWVLPFDEKYHEKEGKNETFVIQGFYKDNKLEKFDVKSETQAQYHLLADTAKIGRIEVHLFAKDKLPAPEPEESLRLEVEEAKDLTEAKKKLATPEKARGIIQPNGKVDPKKVEELQVPEMIHIGSFTITYFEPNSEKN